MWWNWFPPLYIRGRNTSKDGQKTYLSKLNTTNSTYIIYIWPYFRYRCANGFWFSLIDAAKCFLDMHRYILAFTAAMRSAYTSWKYENRSLTIDLIPVYTQIFKYQFVLAFELELYITMYCGWIELLHPMQNCSKTKKELDLVFVNVENIIRMHLGLYMFPTHIHITWDANNDEHSTETCHIVPCQ